MTLVVFEFFLAKAKKETQPQTFRLRSVLALGETRLFFT